MKHSITRFSVHHSSLMLAILYGIFGIIYIPIVFLMDFASPGDEQIPAIAALFIPLIFFVITYVAMAIFLTLYNAIAKVVGGVEIVLSDESGAAGVEGQ